MIGNHLRASYGFAKEFYDRLKIYAKVFYSDKNTTAKTIADHYRLKEVLK